MQQGAPPTDTTAMWSMVDGGIHGRRLWKSTLVVMFLVKLNHKKGGKKKCIKGLLHLRLRHYKSHNSSSLTDQSIFTCTFLSRSCRCSYPSSILSVVSIKTCTHLIFLFFPWALRVFFIVYLHYSII